MTDLEDIPDYIEQPEDSLNPFTGCQCNYPILFLSTNGYYVQYNRPDKNDIKHKWGADSAVKLVIIGSPARVTKEYYGPHESGRRVICYSYGQGCPQEDSIHPQSEKCSDCTHNEESDAYDKGEACVESHDLSVSLIGDMKTPMLLKVPKNSFDNLYGYGAFLAKRKLRPRQVITEVAVNVSLSDISLSFIQAGFPSEEEYETINKVYESDSVPIMLGIPDEDEAVVDAQIKELMDMVEIFSPPESDK